MKKPRLGTKILTVLFLLMLGEGARAFAQSASSQQYPVPVNTYRGKRPAGEEVVESPQRRFIVEKISAEQNTEYVILIVAFNIPVNPLSVGFSNVEVNDSPLSNKAVIKFSRTGTEVHISIPIQEILLDIGERAQQLDVCIKNIRAYDGSKMDECEIEKLEFNVAYNCAE